LCSTDFSPLSFSNFSALSDFSFTGVASDSILSSSSACVGIPQVASLCWASNLSQISCTLPCW
ncbi:hypothetical protein P3X46_013957, partial [Hevea brasiliensis]